MDEPRREFFTYRVTLIIGPAPGVPGFGPGIARMVGVLKRAGHNVTVQIVRMRDDDG